MLLRSRCGFRPCPARILEDRFGGSEWSHGFWVDGTKAGGRGITSERQQAGGHFVENGTEGKKIGAGIKLFAECLFGGHVSYSAESGAGGSKEILGESGATRLRRGTLLQGCAGVFGEAEVEEFGMTARCDEEVGGFDVGT